MQRGEAPSFAVGSVGRGDLQRLKTEDGKQAQLINAPVAAGFGVDTLQLATADGARWSDPEMRQWESGGHAKQSDFDWSG